MIVTLHFARAISQSLSVVLVIGIIVAAFAGYVAGSSGGQRVTEIATTPPADTVTTTASLIYPTTVTDTITSIDNGHVITFTKYIVVYNVEVDTEVIYVQSSTTYTCMVGTANLFNASTTTSFASTGNASGIFSATITTVHLVDVSYTTTTVTGIFPLVTNTITTNGSTSTTTFCQPE